MSLWYARVIRHNQYVNVTLWYNSREHAGNLIVTRERWEELRPLIEKLPGINIQYMERKVHPNGQGKGSI